MVYTSDASITKIKKRFPEILALDSNCSDDITLRLYKDVSQERKQEIIDAVKKCGFNNVNFITSIVFLRFYGNKELTDDEKRKIIQALHNLANVMHDCGIHISETSLGFSLPKTKKDT